MPPPAWLARLFGRTAMPASAPANPPASASPRSAAAAPAGPGSAAPATADAQAWIARGNAALDAGHLPEATRCYQQALAAQPSLAAAAVNLGFVLIEQGRRDEAAEALHRALAISPTQADALFMLGRLALERQDPAAAIAHLEALRAAHPGFGLAYGLLCRAYAEAGKPEQAEAALRAGLALNPNAADLHRDLGVLLLTRGRVEAARASFTRATELAPNAAEAWIDLGAAHRELQQFAQAEAALKRALALAPEAPTAHAQLGVLAVQRGDTAAALRHYEQALRLDPDNLDVRSNQLWVLCYGAEPETYAAAARDYGQRLVRRAQPLADGPAGRALGTGEPGQRTERPERLRVGLVSGDLRAHPVGFFIESVLPDLGRHGIDVHAFPTSNLRDEVTVRLARACVGETPLVGLPDAVAARRVREQGIHLLLDLAGHTAYHRLGVFAHRPAPVQATWLGYFASTGVPTIDYLLADRYSVPDELHSQFVEAVWHLPHTRLCFTPPGDAAALPVAPPPVLENGHITFGSYQNLSKVGDDVLAAWRQVLQAMPTARLRLQSRQTGADGRAALLARLAAAGFDLQRIVLVPPAPRAAYLASYAEVDLLLDTFPFPGGTTTCEALWMGVPTVTLAGRSMMANQGKALLSCAGLADWVAADVPGYVDLALARAADLDGLAELRQRLRPQVLASPLFDAPRFAADLAAALWAMWHKGPR